MSPSGIVTRYRFAPAGMTLAASEGTATAEGTSTIEYWSTDMYGNAEALKSASVRIDKTAPVTVDDALLTYNDRAVVHLTAHDGLSGVASTVYAVDGVPGTGTSVVIADPGPHTITYYSIDAAGNIESMRSSGLWVIPIDTATTMRLSGASSVKAKRSYRLTGAVTPSAATGRVTIVLKRSVHGHWTSIKTARVTLTDGRFSYSYTPTVKGTWRAYVTYTGADNSPRGSYLASPVTYKTFTVK
jgi:hypothetical protein